LIYEEFFEDQLKIHLRREFYKKPNAQSFKISSDLYAHLKNIFPFSFTVDQESTIKEIHRDLANFIL